MLGTPLDSGGWFLREDHVEVVTRVENVHALSSIILWIGCGINISGTGNFVIIILNAIRVHIGPYHVCQHHHFNPSAPCSLPVHTGVCNVLLYREFMNGDYKEPVTTRSQALNYTAAQFEVLVFSSSNYVAEGTKETVSISNYSMTKCWVFKLNISITFITCVSTNKPQAQFLTHLTLPLFRHRVKLFLVDYWEWGNLFIFRIYFWPM